MPQPSHFAWNASIGWPRPSGRTGQPSSTQLRAKRAGSRDPWSRAPRQWRWLWPGDGDLFADDPGAWRRVIDIDLTALIDCTRLALRAMRRAGAGGVIVNLASLIGLYPMAAAPVYSAAKAGVVSFTRSLASLAGESGIRVNAICPELVDTPLALAMGEEVMAGLRASQSVLTPEEVAEWVVRLAEDDSRAGAILQITKAEGGTYVE